jgi:hypothetical protein
MAYSSILAQIKTLLSAVSDIGQVYDNIRWAKDRDDFFDLFSKVIDDQRQIRCWFISRSGGQDGYGALESGLGTKYSIPINQRLIRYDIVIDGFISFSDNDTEVVFQTLVDAVRNQFKDKITLNNSALERGPISYTLEHVKFSDQLCHHVNFEFFVLERDNITPV